MLTVIQKEQAKKLLETILTKITVYIASPYTSGDTEENVLKSMLIADKLDDLGFCSFSPLLTHFRHILKPRSYDEWMQYVLEWLIRCDCVLRLEGISNGADIEVYIANKFKMPVFYSIDELIKFYGENI